MEATVKKIVELLSSDNAELQCAAAIVLGELQPRDKAVAKALGGALASQNARLRVCALDAIA